MPVLTQQERDALTVEHFIFHVVHHGGAEPLLFESTPIGDFERFFVGRIIDTLSGNRFVFTDGSETHAALRAAQDDPTQFVETSKALARRFHRNDGRFQRGILIVTALRTGERRFHSLIKYDHERMVAFDVVDAGAALRDVVNGLTESRKALQKSALIELAEGGGQLVVVDRSKPTGITDFFRDFLQVERLHGEGEMTATLAKALVRTVQEHADALPVGITARVRPRLVEIAQERPDFEPDVFFADFFGAHGSEAVRAGFDANLARLGLDGESFTFEPTALPAVGQRRFRTREGVSIVVPEQASDTVAFEEQEDGSTVVRIRTGHVTER
ncbi:nucleoid-associated protein [Methylorubrum thiocyanatum]|uniref:Nucleoid-associated protein n=1 Tax=Methylorubrum thiocyanatum TaxID=47958 RepID=A0AA40S519_9HYPH|nr:nucleoid-associated protein [Methylorubrum thiocyanatum]MBA8914721.1 hypothetical protein [Methylorubrum thiocyanatum]GJE79134.1 hypothetical protein CJNNKLLH_0460 [Methylorubrum thiocyanatum]